MSSRILETPLLDAITIRDQDVRQSTLKRRSSTSSFFGQEDMSRLENLMERIEGGQQYGDQCDIDVLLGEVVKRLENRVVSKIDELLARIQPGVPISAASTTKSPRQPDAPPMITKKPGSKPKPRLEPNMDLLNHEAQDLVQDVVMSSIDVAISGMSDDEEEQIWRRLDEFLDDRDSRPQPSQGSSRTRPQESPRKATAQSSYKQKTPITAQSSSKQKTPMASSSTPRATPTPNKPRGVITTDNVDSTYTYVLRNSVQRSIPKYLGKDGKSKAAVMHMFNDIRLAMADDSLEDIIVDALRDAYLTQERDTYLTQEEEMQEKKGATKAKKDSAKRENAVPKKTAMSSRGKQAPQAERGRQYFESRAWSNRDDDQQAKSMPLGVRSVKAPASKTDTRDIAKHDRFDETRVRSNQDKPRPVSGGWTRQESDSSTEDVDTFYSALDVDQFYSVDNERATGAVKEARLVNMSAASAGSSKKQVQFAGGLKKSPSTLEDWKTETQNMGDATMRHDSNLNYLVRRHVGRALPKFTYNKMVTRALNQLSEKLMDEIPLQPACLDMNHDDVDFTSTDKAAQKEVRKPSKASKRRDDEELPWVSKGNEKNNQRVSTTKNAVNKGSPSEAKPWVTRGQSAKKREDTCSQDMPWVTRGDCASTSSKVTNDSYDDLIWVRSGNQDDTYTVQKRTSTPARELPSRMSISTQTSTRALNDCPGCCPQTVTAGRGWNKNSNQSGDTLILSSESSIHDEIFYDALCCTPVDCQFTSDYHTDEMSKSFLKRFRLNLLFRKQKKHHGPEEKKFVKAVHKVIEARRSGCIDDDGNFIQSIPPPSPKNDGQKSPPPAVKPKPKKSSQLDKNGNSVKRESGRKRSSSRRRHNPDRESYPLPEEDDGSEGYASASEMDDFNPTAFLERNRRSAENRFREEEGDDDGDDADVESDSDGLNSPNRRVRFSDDVQHFGEILALKETESTDNLDAEDDELDISRLSLKSKIELFEKVGSNEFLDDRSYQGSPPPDLPDTVTLPTKDRVKLFEDITSGRKPTTSASTHKTPRRAVDSCQFTLTASKISFFEELSGVSRD